MEENKQNLPAILNMSPDKITDPVLTAFFNKEISRKEYQSVLQNLEKIKPTKENLIECKKVMGEIEKVVTNLTEYAGEVGNPYFKAHRAILAAMKSLLAPISSKVSIIKAEMKSKNDELQADLAKAQAEQTRIDGIKTYMGTFINNCTQFITLATTDKQIGSVQMRIGSEKSRTGFYAEFLDEFKEKCALLDPLINERKEYIRKEAELSAAASAAIAAGDVEAAADIKEQQESLESEIEENVLRLQEKAFEQIANDTPIIVAEPVGDVLKGRNYWRWEVLDVEKLYKKHPELVTIEPNKEAIDKFMSENRIAWNNEKKKEVLHDGIKFFIKKML